MKMRKITAFITAFVAILATFSFLNPTLAKADEPTTTTILDCGAISAEFVKGYKSYKSNYLFSFFADAVDDKATADEDKISYNDYTYTFAYELKDSTALTEDQKKNTSASGISITTETVGEGDDQKTQLKDGSGNTVKFNADGDYRATLSRAAKSGDDRTAKEFATVDFTVIDKPASLTLEYDFDVDALKEYVELIKEEAESVDFGDDFRYPELRKLITVNYFDYSDLQLTLYHTSPEASGFTKVSPSTSSSSKEFELDEIGYYSFYVGLCDPYQISEQDVNLSGLTAKQEGNVVNYYDGEDVKFVRTASGITLGEGYEDYSIDYLCDADGDELCPIFTFNYVKTATPKVEVDDANDTPKGYHKLVYKNVDKLITIDTVDSRTTRYRLYFSTTNVTTGSDWTHAVGAEKLAELAQGTEFNSDDLASNNGVFDVTEVEAFDFSTSTRYFTVAAKGYYYVVCEVGTDFGQVTVCTNAIDATNEFTTVKYARDWGKFFENNTTAVIFLGIAVLSFIGLLLVIFIKPKDKETEKADALPKNKG